MFAKSPIAGNVKTRLIPLLGPKKACQLHEEMVASLMQRLSNSKHKIQIWTDNLAEGFSFPQFKTEQKLQLGRDIGEKMRDAMENGLKTFNQVVLVGSDLPEVDHLYINQALSFLKNFDYVIGPTEDGGFGLIAGKHCDYRIFRNINWGQDKVLSRLIENIVSLRLTYALLPVIWDVDEPIDYFRYKKWRRDRANT